MKPRHNNQPFVLRHILLTISIPLLLAGPLFACDFCGAYMGITPFENQNSFSLNHRYRVFNGYANLDQSSRLFPTGAYRLVNPPYSIQHGTTSSSGNTFSNSDFESYKVFEMRGKYFFHPKFEINAMIPFVNNKQKAMGEESKVTGFGDISLFVGWHAIQKIENVNVKQRLIVGLGIKFPTGKSTAHYADGDRISVLLQAGTGSTDGFAYLTYTAAKEEWRWGLTTLGKLNGTNKYDEQVRSSTVNSAFLAYQFRSCSWMFLPQIQFYQEYTAGLQQGIELVQGTGMNMVLAGPGIDAYWKNIGINIGAQLPIYQQTDEMNMKTSGRLMVGLSYNFNNNHYLLE